MQIRFPSPKTIVATAVLALSGCGSTDSDNAASTTSTDATDAAADSSRVDAQSVTPEGGPPNLLCDWYTPCFRADVPPHDSCPEAEPTIASACDLPARAECYYCDDVVRRRIAVNTWPIHQCQDGKWLATPLTCYID